MSDPAIVIGSSAEQKLPSLVLEHTIKKRVGGRKIRVIHTYDMKMPDAKKLENKTKTGFSWNRFAIPAIMGRQGTAAYLECDQIVFRDVGELLGIPFGGATVLRPRNQTSVLLLDCSRLKWDVQTILNELDAGKFAYRQLMDEICIEPRENIRNAIPDEWNSLERYEAGKTALLHYTAMNAQPWRRWWPHPLLEIWMNELKDAISARDVTMAVIEEEVARKHVVPQVLEAARQWVIR